MKYLNRKYILAVLLAVGLLSITGCSLSPTYYSLKEIKNYVKNVFGKEYKLTDTDQANHSYKFQNEEGFSFTARTTTRHITFDASETSFYDKFFTTDYTARVLEYHADEVKELLSKYDLNVDTSGITYYKINVEEADEFKTLAEFISELDSILKYRFTNDHIPSGMSQYDVQALSIEIVMEDVVIADIHLSSDDDERFDNKQVYSIIEENYVDRVKQGKIDDTIDTALWNAYPARVISPVYINGESLSTDNDDTYDLYYQRDMDAYLMSHLDICQDFEGFPYNYSRKGIFADLVRRLGGTYSCDDWKAVWKIGDVTWKATLHTKKRSEYDYMEVTRNGEKIKLSEGEATKYNGTTSGRKYTVEDLEQMLDVDFVIDQVKMDATIKKNNG